MVKITFQDLMHQKTAQKPPEPKKKLRKKPVKVGSLSPEAKNAIRYILAERLWIHKLWAGDKGKPIWMHGTTLVEWFVVEKGNEYPGYTKTVMLAILMDANETGSPILRVDRGKYIVNEEVFRAFKLPVA